MFRSGKRRHTGATIRWSVTIESDRLFGVLFLMALPRPDGLGRSMQSGLNLSKSRNNETPPSAHPYNTRWHQASTTTPMARAPLSIP